MAANAATIPGNVSTHTCRAREPAYPAWTTDAERCGLPHLSRLRASIDGTAALVYTSQCP